MGYTTQFKGRFEVTPPLNENDQRHLEMLAATRRVARDTSKLPPGAWGHEGEFCPFYEGPTASVLDVNRSPACQPGLWLGWVPTSDGRGLEWDGSEKFYTYAKWLLWVVERFLKPRGYVVNGEVQWRGEDFDDMGVLSVENNHVTQRIMDGDPESVRPLSAWAKHPPVTTPLPPRDTREMKLDRVILAVAEELDSDIAADLRHPEDEDEAKYRKARLRRVLARAAEDAGLVLLECDS